MEVGTTKTYTLPSIDYSSYNSEKVIPSILIDQPEALEFISI
jgi:hypothetical protein